MLKQQYSGAQRGLIGALVGVPQIEESRNRATKSDSTRQEKLKRLGLGQGPKEGEGDKDVKE